MIDFDKIRVDYGTVEMYCDKHGFTSQALYQLPGIKKSRPYTKNYEIRKQLKKDGYWVESGELKTADRVEI